MSSAGSLKATVTIARRVLRNGPSVLGQLGFGPDRGQLLVKILNVCVDFLHTLPKRRLVVTSRKADVRVDATERGEGWLREGQPRWQPVPPGRKDAGQGWVRSPCPRSLQPLERAASG